MKNLLLIWGAGGHGKVVLDAALSCARFDRFCFLDDDAQKAGASFCGWPILGGAENLAYLAGTPFVVAVGNNQVRAGRFDLGLRSGLRPAAFAHSSAVISPSAAIGPGTVIMPLAVVNAGARIGRNCIVNTGAIVEHDCEIGSHVHISPRAALGGAARVADYAHVGLGAIVLPRASIGTECVVGAGAVVLKEAPARCAVMGIPARVKEGSFEPCKR